MKDIPLSLLLVPIMIMVFITACNPGSKLSNDEAKQILERHFKYPIAYGATINLTKRDGNEPQQTIDYLLKNGFIDSSPVGDGMYARRYYKPTEQGKKYLGDGGVDIQNISDNGWIQIAILHAMRAIKSVDEVLLDTKNGTAKIEYTEVLLPNEPIYSAIFLKSHEGKIGYGEKIGATTTKKATLKQYDKGWRVDEGK